MPEALQVDNSSDEAISERSTTRNSESGAMVCHHAETTCPARRWIFCLSISVRPRLRGRVGAPMPSPHLHQSGKRRTPRGES